MVSTSAWAGVVLLSSAAQGGEHLLARVPEGLEVAGDLVRRNNRNALSRRSALVWSADGRQVAYVGQRGDERVPVIGAEVGEGFGAPEAPLLAGGRVFFHVARVKDETHEQHWLRVDGERIGQTEDWMGELAVSADGERVAYWTHPGAKFGGASAGGKYVLVLGTHTGSQWSFARGDKWPEAATVRFAAASKDAFAAAYDRKGGWLVLRFGKRETKLCAPCPGLESFALSADGGALAFVRTEAPSDLSSAFLTAADEPELVFREKRVAAKQLVASVVVDARGEHVAYVVTSDGNRTAAIDGEKDPRGSHAFALELVFDPAGEELAFVAVDGGAESPDTSGWITGGEWYVVVRPRDGALEPRALPRFLEIRDLVWDAKGERLAYAARDAAGWRIVCGETRSEGHEDVGVPVFSADGHTLGFGSRDRDELWWRELALP